MCVRYEGNWLVLQLLQEAVPVVSVVHSGTEGHAAFFPSACLEPLNLAMCPPYNLLTA